MIYWRVSALTFGLLSFFWCGQLVLAAEIRVAVASNFTHAMTEIARQFESVSGHQVVLVFGSTGKHYAQIRHGAPFDVFFAADARRPQMLEDDGQIVAGSRFTYAIGRLVLWCPDGRVDVENGSALAGQGFRHLAIANPRLAPYGRAARQVLEAMGHWDKLQQRIVRGENIAQAHQFVASGNAEIGFVAYSQIMRPGQTPSGAYWLPSGDFHEPIVQQAVQLTPRLASTAFLDFVKSEKVQAIVARYGYDIAGE